MVCAILSIFPPNEFSKARIRDIHSRIRDKLPGKQSRDYFATSHRWILLNAICWRFQLTRSREDVLTISGLFKQSKRFKLAPLRHLKKYNWPHWTGKFTGKISLDGKTNLLTLLITKRNFKTTNRTTVTKNSKITVNFNIIKWTSI